MVKVSTDNAKFLMRSTSLEVFSYLLYQEVVTIQGPWITGLPLETSSEAYLSHFLVDDFTNSSSCVLI